MLVRGLDLGGSQTRIAETRSMIYTNDSLVMEINESSPVKKYITDGYSDFLIELSPVEGLNKRRFVRGEALDHYDGVVHVCDNQSNKVEQEVIYINAAYTLARNLADRFHSGEEVFLGACIPTSEFYSDKKDYPEMFKACISGEYSVYFPIANRRVTFAVSRDHMKVFPEGVVAAFKYKADANFVNGITLIIDVGYRSTDITLLNRFKPVGKSAVSRPKGGINIEAALLAALERDNILVSKDEVKEALNKKYIRVGTDYRDVTDIFNKYADFPADARKDSILTSLKDMGVDATEADIRVADKSSYIGHENRMIDITDQVVSAKKNFASSIKADVIDVLATQMMNLASVNNLMPIGRPFVGGLSNENTLASLLCKELGSNLRYYSVPNLGTANVEEIIGVMNADNV